MDFHNPHLFACMYKQRFDLLEKILLQLPIPLIQIIKDYERMFRGEILYQWEMHKTYYGWNIHGDWITFCWIGSSRDTQIYSLNGELLGIIAETETRNLFDVIVFEGNKFTGYTYKREIDVGDGWIKDWYPFVPLAIPPLELWLQNEEKLRLDTVLTLTLRNLLTIPEEKELFNPFQDEIGAQSSRNIKECCINDLIFLFGYKPSSSSLRWIDASVQYPKVEHWFLKGESFATSRSGCLVVVESIGDSQCPITTITVYN
jgi:hypothetical protein